MKVPKNVVEHLRKARCPSCYAPLEAAAFTGERVIVMLTPGSIRSVKIEPWGRTELHVRCSAFPQHEVQEKLGVLAEQELLEFVRKIHKIKNDCTKHTDKKSKRGS